MKQISVLFVCLGNICRSPTAHAVMEQKLEYHNLSSKVFVDSAGTYGGHTGELPDSRAMRAAKACGYEMQHIRSRKIEQTDFQSFNYIFAMDKSNMLDLRRMVSDKSLLSKVRLMSSYSEYFRNEEVPDPYYDSESGFEYVLSMIEESTEQIISKLIIPHKNIA